LANATASADGTVATGHAHFGRKVVLMDRNFNKIIEVGDFRGGDDVGWDSPGHVEAGAPSGDFYVLDQHRGGTELPHQVAHHARAGGTVVPHGREHHASGEVQDARIERARFGHTAIPRTASGVPSASRLFDIRVGVSSSHAVTPSSYHSSAKSFGTVPESASRSPHAAAKPAA
jgi:hypothetical protein